MHLWVEHGLHIDEISKINFPDPTFPTFIFRDLKGDFKIDPLNDEMIIEGTSYKSDFLYDFATRKFGDFPTTWKEGRFYIVKRADINKSESKVDQASDDASITVLDKKKIEVGSDIVKVKLWDADRQDGDIVDVYLNGEIVFKDLKVTIAGKIFYLNLVKGKNLIEIEAKNEGIAPPNTSAIKIYVGDEDYQVVLSAKKGARDSISIVVD